MSEEGNRPETSNDMKHAELLVVYQTAVDDIERAKQWAWQVTYQVIIAQFAAVTIARTTFPNGAVARFVFIAMVVGMAGIATGYIWDAQASLSRFRGRLDACRPHLQDQTNKILGEVRAKPRWPLEWAVGVSTVFAIVLLFA